VQAGNIRGDHNDRRTIEAPSVADDIPSPPTHTLQPLDWQHGLETSKHLRGSVVYSM